MLQSTSANHSLATQTRPQPVPAQIRKGPPPYVLKKPEVALQSILRTTAEEENSQLLPTDLSILRDDTSSHLMVDPAEVIAQV